MKLFLTLFLLLGLGSAVNVRAQGNLTPSAAPAPTMKSLDQIEARTPISSAPYTISASGSYYLTGNLSVASGDAITITADGVSLDLNGFAITTKATGASGTGILLGSGQEGIHIRNGSIMGSVTYSGTAFSGGGFVYGIASLDTGNPSQAYDVVVSQVAVSGCASYGIDLVGNDTGTVVERCQARSISGYGIVAAVVANCSASQCLLDGINGGVVRDSTGDNVGPTSSGIAATAITRSVGTSVQSVGIYANNVATGCYGTSTSGYGLYAVCAADSYGNLGSAAHNALQTTTGLNCYGYNGGSASTALGISAHVANNCFGFGATGITADVALGCYASATIGNGINGSVAENCRGVSNSANGMVVAAVQNCYGVSTSNTGIIASTAMGSSGQGFIGIQSPVINNCTGTGTGSATGISCTGTALNSTGTSITAAGLNAGIAFGCFGSSTSNATTNPGINATLANSCYGSGATTVTATNKYNTP